jgi:cation diffusion facilitator family transporter
MHQTERYWAAKKVTLIGAVINALLGCTKLLGGFLFHSHALVADGVHSFSDLLTDGMVLFASKYGSQDADDSHPYGHQRIETAATLLLALLLILTGFGITWDACYEVFYKKSQSPGGLALPIALCSIVANEGLFHYTQRVGKRIQSDLILANAWHHRSDAAASIVVLIGLIGSLAGHIYLDALAAIVVGLMIIHMGWNYGWNSVKELVDTAVDPQLLVVIERTILAIDGVQKIHQLRSRMMGRDVFIDVHVLVASNISVSEGHYIAQNVHHALMASLDQVKDVTVHVDPEDDETCCPSLHLPNRSTLEHQLLHPWCTDYPGIQTWVLHYLDGKLSMDVICDQQFEAWQALSERIEYDLASYSQVLTVRLFAELQEITLAKSTV